MNLTSERAVLDVMKRHIDALNALDENSLGNPTLSSLSSSRLKVMYGQKKELPCRFSQRAGNKWALSKWDTIDVQGSSSDKVHLLVQVVRFDDNENVIARFKSLWVITLKGEKWAAQFRSSFAAA